MNTIDMAALALLAFGLIYGLVRGGFRELLGLAHAILSSVLPLLALTELRSVSNKIFDLPDGRAQGIVPFALGFALTYLCLLGVLGLIRKPLRKVTFSGHRIVGGVVGLIRIVLLLVITMPIALWFVPDDAGYRAGVVESEAFSRVRLAHRRVTILERLLPPEGTAYAKDLDRPGAR